MERQLESLRNEDGNVNENVTKNRLYSCRIQSLHVRMQPSCHFLPSSLETEREKLNSGVL